MDCVCVCVCATLACRGHGFTHRACCSVRIAHSTEDSLNDKGSGSANANGGTFPEGGCWTFLNFRSTFSRICFPVTVDHPNSSRDLGSSLHYYFNLYSVFCMVKIDRKDGWWSRYPKASDGRTYTEYLG